MHQFEILMSIISVFHASVACILWHKNTETLKLTRYRIAWCLANLNVWINMFEPGMGKIRIAKQEVRRSFRRKILKSFVL